jgi:uncharacterized SAM-binding protein YcdF (DUF218 family)
VFAPTFLVVIKKFLIYGIYKFLGLKQQKNYLKHRMRIRTMFDAIVVLGSGLNEKDWKSRVDKAIELFKEKKASHLVMSGKHSFWHKKKQTEAEMMKKYAVSKGIPQGAILKEDKSMDTIGNAFFTRKRILEPNKWKNICVVTSSYHMQRAKFIFMQIMDNRYKLEFAAAKPKFSAREQEKLKKHESKLFTITKDFAKLILEIGVVEKLLFTHHPLYNKKQKPL